jgi:hypothetical protein
MFPPTQSITVGTSNRAHERNCRKWMAVVNLHTDDQHCLGGSVFFFSCEVERIFYRFLCQFINEKNLKKLAI